MKKTVLALTMAASVLALAACNNNTSSEDEVIVKSKVGNVTKNEFYEELLKNPASEQALQLMVLEKVLEDKYEVTDKQIQKEIDKMKEQLGEGFEMYLMQQGLTEESLKDILYLNMLQEAALADGVEVTDEEVEKHAEMMNTELNARHVLVADEETALEVKKKLEAGEDFAKVAKEYSTEPAAEQSGGDLGWFGHDKMVPEFWKGAYALEVKKISEPIQSQHGYHIVEVTEKRQVDEKNAVDKEEARKNLQLEKADSSTIIDKISKLMKEADVKVEDKDLKSALDIFLTEPAK